MGERGPRAGARGGVCSFVDVIVELRRYARDDLSDPRRVLTALGRLEDIRAETVVELGNEGFRVLGERKDACRENLVVAILETLPRVGIGLTVEEIQGALPIEPRPGISRLRGLLSQGATENRWTRSGAGKKGDPHRFAAIPDSGLARSMETPSPTSGPQVS